MLAMKDDQVPYDRLLLDPNNYRYQDGEDFTYANGERFHEDSVQEKAYRRLRLDETLLPDYAESERFHLQGY